MPTGYTSEIYNGKEMSAKEFIMRCCRAFGVAVHMRDEPLDVPIPEKLEPLSSYHPDKIAELKAQLEERMAHPIPKDKLEEEYQKELDKAYARHLETMAEKEALAERYKNLIKGVEAWTPPTPEHEELKNFSLNQLKTSLEHDCRSYEFEFLPKDKWIERYGGTAYIEEELAYHMEQHSKEVERLNKANVWLRQLRDSLQCL